MAPQTRLRSMIRRVIFGAPERRLCNDPTLQCLFMEADLKFVDIGARGSAVPQLMPLAPFAHYYAFEPDPSEAERLAALLPERWRGVTVVPIAIGSLEGEATLFVTRAPGLSSLLCPDVSVTGRFFKGNEFEVVSTRPVSVLGLDQAAAQYGFEDACFVKLDTQGTELDILHSGRELLHDSVVGVQVEVEFSPFYDGQPLFADVDAFLRGLNFSLFDLWRVLARRASYRAREYSRRQVVWAHALYLKEPEILRALHGAGAVRHSARLLALALAYWHHDLALEIVGGGLLKGEHGSQVRSSVERYVEGFSRYVARRHLLRRIAMRAPAQRDRRYEP